MEEQSDTPITTTFVSALDGEADLVCRFLEVTQLCKAIERDLYRAEEVRNTATRERDEARAEVAEIESVLRASGALNQKLLDEVDRLRALTICGCGDHFNAAFRGLCQNCVAAGKVAP